MLNVIVIILFVYYIDYLLHYEFSESNISGFLAKIKKEKIDIKVKSKKETYTTSKKYDKTLGIH
jgi:hypothetical protein